VPSAPEPLLVLEDVSFAYLDRFPALDAVSFSIRAGERVALLGANGCGKSTLLKILAGLLFPGTGEYRAFGEVVTEDRLEDEQFSTGFRQRIGLVFQNPEAQVFSPSVREELAFGPLQLGLHPDAVSARVQDLLRMFDIEALAERAPYQLSVGQKKRVAIAATLAGNPELLLFDEPTAGLDPRTEGWLLELLTELGDAGKTLVSATHDLGSLPWCADRCLVFSEEHALVADLTPAELLADQELMLAMNLVHGRTQGSRTDDEGRRRAGGTRTTMRRIG